MSLGEWIDIPALKAMSRHVSAVVGAIAMFILVGILVELFVPEGPLKTALRIVEGFVLLGLMGVFAWHLFRVLLSRVRNGDGSSYGLLVA